MFTSLKLMLGPMGCCAVEFYTSGEKKNNSLNAVLYMKVKRMFLDVFALFASQSVGCLMETLHVIVCRASK